jgi:hypothetical protein
MLSREILLENLDFPNIRGILDRMEKDQEEMGQLPPPTPPIEKITMAYTDLPVPAQAELLQKNSLLPPELDPSAPPLPVPPPQ